MSQVFGDFIKQIRKYLSPLILRSFKTYHVITDLLDLFAK